MNRDETLTALGVSPKARLVARGYIADPALGPPPNIPISGDPVSVRSAWILREQARRIAGAVGISFNVSANYLAVRCKDHSVELPAGRWVWRDHAWDLMHRSNSVVVTRHPALVHYLSVEEIAPDCCPVLTHATADDVRGKHVFGVLPIHLAALTASLTVIRWTFRRTSVG